MVRNLCLFISLVIFLTTSCYGQTASIRGRVINSTSGEPLQYANVFIDKTTIGTASGENGEFTINNIPFGKIDLIVSYIGYKLKVKTIHVNQSEISTGDVQIDPLEQQLREVVVQSQSDKEWKNNLDNFKKILLGKTDIAESCSILNPWVINFEKAGKTIAISSVEPIQIKNQFLGYKVSFFLREAYIKNLEYSIQGGIHFEELTSTNPSEVLEWAKNRHQAYFRSSRYLFKSIVNQQIRANGFQLYEDIQGSDAYSHLETTNNFADLLGSSIIKKDTTHLVSYDSISNVFRINFDSRLEVHYPKLRTSAAVYTNIRYPVSWILLKGGYVDVNIEGIPLNANDVITSGDMNEDWITRLLPLNYTAPNKSRDIASLRDNRSTLIRLYEQAYIHTDKQYYYPSEHLWFKVYLNYSSPELIGALSEIIYIELIDSERNIIHRKNLLVNQGTAIGDFILDKSLKSGRYYLRAYTSLMRNFGDQNLFIRTIPLLNITDKVNARNEVSAFHCTNNISISSDKSVYKTRDKIKIAIETMESGQPISAHLSMSVTDMQQVVTFDSSHHILKEYPLLKDIPNPGNSLKYPLESGITFSGEVVNKKGRGVTSTLTLLGIESMDLTEIETDSKGQFWVTGLGFYDSSEFILRVADKKSKEIIVKKYETPLADFSLVEVGLDIIPTESPQWIMSAYEAVQDTKILEEVIIRGQKLKDPKDQRSYGKPDFVLESKDINTSYGNLLLTLPGKIPGLIVREVNTPNGTETIISNNRMGGEMMVMINDVPLGGKAADILSGIDPGTVESIEVKIGISGTKVLHGSQGANGVISIYTKDGLSKVSPITETGIQMTKILGYSKPKNFRSPDYTEVNSDTDNADYRSTLYWNPEVITNPKTGLATTTFFASDLRGKYKVTVEGVTFSGEPIRCEFEILVD